MSLHEFVLKRILSLKGKLWSTQLHLAERAGISQSQISRYLKGQGTLTFDSACNLLEALGATIVFPGDKKERDTDPAADHPAPSALEEALRRNLRESIAPQAEAMYATRIYHNIPKEEAVARLRSVLEGTRPLTIQEYYPIAAAVSDFKPGSLIDFVAADIVTRATETHTISLELKEPKNPRMAYGPQKLQEPDSPYKS